MGAQEVQRPLHLVQQPGAVAPPLVEAPARPAGHIAGPSRGLAGPAAGTDAARALVGIGAVFAVREVLGGSPTQTAGSSPRATEGPAHSSGIPSRGGLAGSSPPPGAEDGPPRARGPSSPPPAAPSWTSSGARRWLRPWELRRLSPPVVRRWLRESQWMWIRLRRWPAGPQRAAAAPSGWSRSRLTRSPGSGRRGFRRTRSRPRASPVQLLRRPPPQASAAPGPSCRFFPTRRPGRQRCEV